MGPLWGQKIGSWGQHFNNIFVKGLRLYKKRSEDGAWGNGILERGYEYTQNSDKITFL